MKFPKWLIMLFILTILFAQLIVPLKKASAENEGAPVFQETDPYNLEMILHDAAEELGWPGSPDVESWANGSFSAADIGNLIILVYLEGERTHLDEFVPGSEEICERCDPVMVTTLSVDQFQGSTLYLRTTHEKESGLVFSRSVEWKMGNMVLWVQMRGDVDPLPALDALYRSALKHASDAPPEPTGVLPLEPPVLDCPNYCDADTSYYDGTQVGDECSYYTSPCGAAGCNADSGLCNEALPSADIQLLISAEGYEAVEGMIGNGENFGTVYISGTTRNIDTGEPLPGVTVEIVSGARPVSVTTDENGAYSLAAIVDGGSGVEEFTEIDFVLTAQFDLAIQSLAVYQVVDGGKFVANKPGVARVYFTSPHPEYDLALKVQLLINGVRHGQPIDHIIKRDYAPGEHWIGQHTANFDLGANIFQAGQLEFGAIVIPVGLQVEDRPLSDITYSDPDLRNNVHFNPPESVTATRDLNLMFCSVNIAIRPQDIVNAVALSVPFFKTIYPVSNVQAQIRKCGVAVEYFYATSLGFRGRNVAFAVYSDRMLQNSAVGPGGQLFDYGIGIGPDAFLDYKALGSNTLHSAEGVNYRGLRQDVLIINDYALLGALLAHEIGHHGVGTTEEYIVYPPSGLTLDRSLYDVRAAPGRRIIDPTGDSLAGALRYNIMGSNNTSRTWIDSTSWDKLVDFYAIETAGTGANIDQKGFASPIKATKIDGPGFVITGSISANDSAEIDSIMWLEYLTFSRSDAVMGDHTIRSFNSVGQLISDDPVQIAFGAEDMDLFTALIPGSLSTVSRFELVHNGQVILERVASSNAPDAGISAPAGEISGEVSIVWEVSDADGDALTSYLQYSPNNGASWLSVSEPISEETYNLNFDELPGCGACRMRVLVSDGWHTTTAVADQVFSVSDKPPIVIVDQNEDVGGNPGSILSAFAYDLEDGVLDADQIAWEIDDPLGRIETGETIDLTEWPSGEIGFTVSVQDSAGNTGQAEIEAHGMQGEAAPDSSEDGFLTTALPFICAGSAVLMLMVGGVLVFVYFRRKKQGRSSGCLPIVAIALVVGCVISSGIASWVYLDPSILPHIGDSVDNNDSGSAVPDGYINEQVGLILAAAAEAEVPSVVPNTPAPIQETPLTVQDTPTPVPNTATPALITTFVDDFSSDQGWASADTEKVNMGRTDEGTYRMDFLEAGDTDVQIAMQPYPFDVPMQDLIIRATTSVMNDNVAYGLVCRYRDENNLYGFQVRDTGEFWLWKTVAGKTTTYATATNDILRSPEKVIELSCQGELVRATVNGVGIAELRDTELALGNAGLFAQPFGGGIDSNGMTTYVVFDDFSIELIP